MKTQKRQVTITDLYNLVAHETVSTPSPVPAVAASMVNPLRISRAGGSHRHPLLREVRRFHGQRGCRDL